MATTRITPMQGIAWEIVGRPQSATSGVNCRQRLVLQSAQAVELHLDHLLLYQGHIPA